MIILLLLSSGSASSLDNADSSFHRLHDNLGDDEVSVPFVIRGYEIPRRPFRAGLVQRILVCLHVFLPEFSFWKIVTAELPPLGRVVQSLLQPFLLLLLVDMEIELENGRVFFRE